MGAGGWNGLYPVIRNEPERGKLVCSVGGKEVDVHYPKARLTLFTEVFLAKEMSSDDDAMKTVLHYISKLQPGKLQIFGYVIETTRGNAPPPETSCAYQL